jgi:RNA polymerase sigma factor (sigma-70 family)
MTSDVNDTLSSGFQTTQWQMVMAAGSSDSPVHKQAMEELCKIYWPAIYAHIRRQGFSPADAEDHTQEFFYRLIERPMLNQTSSEKGRFRSYLMACCNHYISNSRDYAKAQKRGGNLMFVSIDTAMAEHGFQATLKDPVTPEREFERGWANALMERVLIQLQRNYQNEGHGDIFALLHPLITDAFPRGEYAQLAARLEVTEANLQVMVHRLRRKHVELLRNEVKSTLLDHSELEDELRHLISALS